MSSESSSLSDNEFEILDPNPILTPGPGERVEVWIPHPHFHPNEIGYNYVIKIPGIYQVLIKIKVSVLLLHHHQVILNN